MVIRRILIVLFAAAPFLAHAEQLQFQFTPEYESGGNTGILAVTSPRFVSGSGTIVEISCDYTVSLDGVCKLAGKSKAMVESCAFGQSNSIVLNSDGTISHESKDYRQSTISTVLCK